MGFFSSLLFGGSDPDQEIGRIGQKAAEREHREPKKGGFFSLFQRTNPQLDRDLGSLARSEERERYYEHERQLADEKRHHVETERPRQLYELEQSYRLPYYKEEVARLKQENSPYLSHAEEQLKYAQASVDRYMHDYDHEYERREYDQKWAFKQQQKEHAKQIFDQGYKARDEYLNQMKRQEDLQDSMNTQSNIGRGGNADRTLGTGSRFRRFGPPQARGGSGRGGRSSYTRPSR